ncbi:DExH-box ATP-dependent RNA helicase DExH1-like [Sinocyclocheilus anshuiensis]|uniref:DExH-box ATP-dependent RNA helicase DExH1-like n=1 Tax=Sinocyclocheilus anshuiensis TaxID=1608454 RepID=UPI0007B87562|nr:PREDICTED: DExH-box ATP-dependent RNA helicase DExH1-like [Sinocyclocheilus anshuiensis]
MIATLNTEKFSKYFNNCSMIHTPGYTYPVKEHLLEDVVELLRSVYHHPPPLFDAHSVSDSGIQKAASGSAQDRERYQHCRNQELGIYHFKE